MSLINSFKEDEKDFEEISFERLQKNQLIHKENSNNPPQNSNPSCQPINVTKFLLSKKTQNFESSRLWKRKNPDAESDTNQMVKRVKLNDSKDQKESQIKQQPNYKQKYFQLKRVMKNRSRLLQMNCEKQLKKKKIQIKKLDNSLMKEMEALQSQCKFKEKKEPDEEENINHSNETKDEEDIRQDLNDADKEQALQNKSGSFPLGKAQPIPRKSMLFQYNNPSLKKQEESLKKSSVTLQQSCFSQERNSSNKFQDQSTKQNLSIHQNENPLIQTEEKSSKEVSKKLSVDPSQSQSIQIDVKPTVQTNQNMTEKKNDNSQDTVNVHASQSLNNGITSIKQLQIPASQQDVQKKSIDKEQEKDSNVLENGKKDMFQSPTIKGNQFNSPINTNNPFLLSTPKSQVLSLDNLIKNNSGQIKLDNSSPSLFQNLLQDSGLKTSNSFQLGNVLNFDQPHSQGQASIQTGQAKGNTETSSIAQIQQQAQTLFPNLNNAQNPFNVFNQNQNQPPNQNVSLFNLMNQENLNNSQQSNIFPPNNINNQNIFLDHSQQENSFINPFQSPPPQNMGIFTGNGLLGHASPSNPFINIQQSQGSSQVNDNQAMTLFSQGGGLFNSVETPQQQKGYYQSYQPKKKNNKVRLNDFK